MTPRQGWAGVGMPTPTTRAREVSPTVGPLVNKGFLSNGYPSLSAKRGVGDAHTYPPLHLRHGSPPFGTCTPRHDRRHGMNTGEPPLSASENELVEALLYKAAYAWRRNEMVYAEHWLNVAIKVVAGRSFIDPPTRRRRGGGRALPICKP
jgi:hypothetical protein